MGTADYMLESHHTGAAIAVQTGSSVQTMSSQTNTIGNNTFSQLNFHTSLELYITAPNRCATTRNFFHLAYA